MKKLVDKLIVKNIIKILNIYRKTYDNKVLNSNNYLDNKIYFELDFLIRLIKERNDKYEI